MVTKKIQPADCDVELGVAFSEFGSDADTNFVPMEELRLALCSMGAHPMSIHDVERMVQEASALDAETGLVDYKRIVRNLLAV